MPLKTLAKATTLVAALLVAAALGGCEENTYRGNDRSAAEVPDTPPADVADAATAVKEADPAQVYPLPMGRDEFTKVVSSNEACSFRMTSSDFPVLVLTTGSEGEDGAKAVMKANGKLFELTPADSSEDGIALRADGVRASVTPDEGDDDKLREATLRFQVEGAEELGFRGYFGCGKPGSTT
ncbi:hypothetical protein A7A08_01447 [Methyloligella halotolerans]|uniref:DUF6692 domain-containing protein n=1 Tax=Methyloligella halotolerans TaxID=1177755 RepID=A0A1E2RZ81_9HYPH|nr:DUF6692 family protein [Methyloligella halotolerans]ODA67415.1 hypothetical protein A7A08_01447 [Methyloligella halotolerans]